MTIRVPPNKRTRGSLYKAAGDARFDEAEFLEDEHPSGAIYLAGYLVECYLKWAFCERNGVQYLQDIPDENVAKFLTSAAGHDLDTLCGIVGYDKHVIPHGMVDRAFQVAAERSPRMRYLAECGDGDDAARFMAAVRVLRQDIKQWANT